MKFIDKVIAVLAVILLFLIVFYFVEGEFPDYKKMIPAEITEMFSGAKPTFKVKDSPRENKAPAYPQDNTAEQNTAGGAAAATDLHLLRHKPGFPTTYEMTAIYNGAYINISAILTAEQSYFNQNKTYTYKLDFLGLEFEDTANFNISDTGYYSHITLKNGYSYTITNKPTDKSVTVKYNEEKDNPFAQYHFEFDFNGNGKCIARNNPSRTICKNFTSGSDLMVPGQPDWRAYNLPRTFLMAKTSEMLAKEAAESALTQVEQKKAAQAPFDQNGQPLTGFGNMPQHGGQDKMTVIFSPKGPASGKDKDLFINFFQVINLIIESQKEYNEENGRYTYDFKDLNITFDDVPHAYAKTTMEEYSILAFDRSRYKIVLKDNMVSLFHERGTSPGQNYYMDFYYDGKRNCVSKQSEAEKTCTDLGGTNAKTHMKNMNFKTFVLPADFLEIKDRELKENNRRYAKRMGIGVENMN